MNTVNIDSELFKNNLTNLIESSQLPACVIYYIVKDIFNSLETEYGKLLQKEYSMQEEEKKENNIQIDELKE